MNKTTVAEPEDQYSWLEEVEGAEALTWIKAHNAKTLEALADADFGRDQEMLAAIMGATDKIAYVSQAGEFLYNFWQDKDNPRGLLRRTTMTSYRSDTTVWETLLDIDALGRDEGENWVLTSTVSLPPDHRYWLIALSRGGSDACITREFDLASRRFVADGFFLPESKSTAAWVDADTLLVSSPLGEGHATSSGYPRTVRRWRRGTPFSAAEIVFEGERTDVSVSAHYDQESGFERAILVRSISFFEVETFILRPTGERQRLDVPRDAFAGVHREWLTLRLRSRWKPNDREFLADSILAIRLEALLAGGREFDLLFEPGERRVVQSMSWSKSRLAISILDHMMSEVLLAEPGSDGWRVTPLRSASNTEAVGIWSIGTDTTGTTSENFFFTITGYLTPPSLHLLSSGKPIEHLKEAPARFDASNLSVSLHEAVAEDGVPIPYFQVSRSDMPLDGDNPTILYGYGGFLVSMLPSYWSTVGKAWLERGGVLVVANIRGGGEFGAEWHKSGTREGKKRAQDDFAMVARDLIARRVTSPRRLGCWGGSNGGLLVGNMLTRFPQLFGAVWCEVPLLDMRRYAKLPPGSIWIEEYGDPDKAEDWAFLQEISPYHLAKGGQTYPPVLLRTSARDDRVHPAHARKMAARLEALGHRVLFYEPVEGGHGAVDFKQAAFEQALGFSFFRHTIGTGFGALADDRPAQ